MQRRQQPGREGLDTPDEASLGPEAADERHLGAHWHGPAFSVLGVAGTTTALYWLRSDRRWVLAVLAALYGPWTLVGLRGDLRQGLWAFAAGEAFGFMLLAWAIVSAAAGWPGGKTPGGRSNSSSPADRRPR